MCSQLLSSQVYLFLLQRLQFTRFTEVNICYNSFNYKPALAGFFVKTLTYCHYISLFLASSGYDLLYSHLPVNDIPFGELLMEEHLLPIPGKPGANT